MYLRRIYNPICRGFVVGHDPTDPMTLILGSGSIGDVMVDSTAFTIPTSEFGQNVNIALYDEDEFPIQVTIHKNGTDLLMPRKLAIVLLSYFYVPPNCSDLKDIDIYSCGFVEDKLFETPFEGSEVVWEKIE